MSNQNLRKSDHSRRAIVTGGTRGIGRAIVKELAARSCCGVLFSDVAFVYNSCDECAEELMAEIDYPGLKYLRLKPMQLHLNKPRQL